MLLNHNAFWRTPTIFILFLATLFSCKKKNDITQSNLDTNLQSVITKAKRYNQHNISGNPMANHLDWNSILIGITLSTHEPYTLTIPVVTEGKRVDTYSTIYIDSAGQIVRQLFFNEQSLSTAKSDDIETDISTKFNLINRQGYVVDRPLLIPFERKQAELQTEAQNKQLNSINLLSATSSGSDRISTTASGNHKTSDARLSSSSGPEAANCSVNFQVTFYFWRGYDCTDFDVSGIHYNLGQLVERKLRDHARAAGNSTAQVFFPGNAIQVGGLNEMKMENLGSSTVLQTLMTEICASFQFPFDCNGGGAPMTCTVYNYNRRCLAPPITNPGSGGSVSSIIRDPSINSNQQISCLMDKILNSSNRANQKFLKAFMDNTKYNVTFKAAAVIPTTTGSANASTVTTSGSKNIDIYIKTSYVEANSMWNVARTMVHEMAHAYLSQKLMSIGGASNLAQNLNNKEFKDLFEYYTKFVNPTTGQLSTTANGNFEHAAMAGLLIDDMARGIQDFVEMNTPSIKNETSVTFDNYKAIAWLGLTNTGAYDSFKAITGETDATQQLKITTVQVNTTNACN